MSGPNVSDVLNSAESTTITIGAGATVYTKSFSLKYGRYFALAYKAASGGSIDLDIQLEQAPQRPTVEGSSDVKWVIPTSLGDIHDYRQGLETGQDGTGQGKSEDAGDAQQMDEVWRWVLRDGRPLDILCH